MRMKISGNIMSAFDMSQLELFGVMRNKMSFMNERQRIIAQNIANANTPGYKTRDIKVDFSDVLNQTTGKTQLKRTDPMHLGGTTSGIYGVREIENMAVKPNGNNVVLEDELLKLQENNQSFQTTAELYKKMSGMLRSAIGQGQ